MKLIVLFPGIGYTCDKPLLYYANKLSRGEGFDEIIQVKYSYTSKEGLRGNKEKMLEVFNILYSQTKEELKDVKWSEYDEILFVSKSVGTVVASAFARENNLYSNCMLTQVLYTPLEFTFLYNPENAISFIGTSDPWSDAYKVIEEAKKAGVPIHVYEGANHSLETGNLTKDIDILKDVIDKTGEFILKSSKT